MLNHKNKKKCKVLKVDKNELTNILISDLNTLKDSGISSAHSRILESRAIYSDVENIGRTKKKNKSFYRSRKVKKEVIKLIASLTEPILRADRFIAVESLIGRSDKEDTLNYQWNYLIDKDTIAKKLAKHFTIDGICIAKVSWLFNKETYTKIVKEPVYTTDKEEIVKFLNSLKDEKRKEKVLKMYQETGKIPIKMQDVEVKVTEIKDNRPIIEVIDPLTVFMAKDMSYIYHVYRLTYAEIIKRRGEFESQIKFILDSLKEDTTTDSSFLYQYSDLNSVQDEALFDYFQNYVNENKLIANKSIEFIEYWGDITDKDGDVHSVVATIVKDKIVRLDLNTLGILPFAVSQFDINNDTPYSEGLPMLLDQEQIGLNRVMRIIDNATIDYDNDQKLIDESLFTDITQKNNFLNGRTAFFKRGMNPATAIYNNSIKELPRGVFDLQALYQNEINIVSALEPKGMQNPVDVADPITDLEASRLRDFSQVFKNMFTIIGTMNSKFLLHNTKINKDITVDLEKLSMAGSVIKVDIMTNRERDKKAQQIINLLSTQSAHMSETSLMNHYQKLASLWNHSDLAKSIKKELETPRPPDPMVELEVEKMKLENAKLQLEIEKVKADAIYNQARAKEAEAKALERLAIVEAGKAKAEATNLTSQADLFESQSGKFDAQTMLFNQEFSLVETGAKKEEEERKLEFQHLANLEREKIRTERELTLNEKKHQQAVKEKEVQDKNLTEESGNEKSPLLEYIRNGTLNNDTYDTMDAVYRDILDKNGLDTDKYKNPTIEQDKEIKE